MMRIPMTVGAVLLLSVMTAGAATADATATADLATADPSADASRLGHVAGDTVFVELGPLVDAALERNEMLLASGAMTEAADARADGAWAGFLPQVSVSEFFMRSDDALSSFGFKLQNRAVTPMDFNPALLNDPGETNNWITRLQLMQPIFNGGMAWHGKAAADAAARAAHFNHVRARQTVALQATQVYEGLVLAQSMHDVVQAAVASAEAHVGQARSLLDAEMATEADVLQATVFLSALKQQLIIVDNHVAMAGEMVRLLTAIETPLHVAAAAPAAAGDGMNAAAPDTAAVRARADIQAREHEAEAAARMAGVALGAMLPHVNMSVQRDLYSLDDAFGSDARSWTLGVYATWDVFKGLQNISNLKQARAEKRAAAYMYDFELRKARHEALQAWRDAEASAARVEVARGAVDAARASLRIVSNQYREGLASMVDLLDVQAAATKAEGDLVQARHDYRVDLARLIHAAGSGAAEEATRD